jgi:beta-barrel assembly-enhancing protease
MRKHSFKTRGLAILLVLLAAAIGWAQTLAAPQLPDPGTVSGISKEEQEKLGLQAAAEVYKQMPVLPDSSPETQYIQQLGKKLVAVIPEQYSWPYQFHVIQQKEINAFALPGGPMFVNVGTITAADNEVELVGVMAHEMSHVYMQHSAKQVSKASLTQGIVGVLGGILGNSTVGNLARAGIQLGAGTVMLKYSRDDEAQADAVGAVIMYKAGYNPQALAQFFEKLQKESGGAAAGPQFLSDHPNPGNRTVAIDREIANWPREKYVSGSTAFTNVKQHAAGVKVYSGEEIANGAKQGMWVQENQKNGATPRDLGIADAGTGATTAVGTSLANVKFEQVRPSGDFAPLENNVFLVSRPSNWQASNDQNSVTIAPVAGVAAGSVAYGVIISGTENRDASSLDQATQTLAKNMAQSNPGMRVLGNPERIAVNGLQGRSVYLSGDSPVQQDGKALPERDWLVTVPRAQGGLLYLVFVAPEKDFSQLRPTYQRMLESLQVK